MRHQSGWPRASLSAPLAAGRGPAGARGPPRRAWGRVSKSHGPAPGRGMGFLKPETPAASITLRVPDPAGYAHRADLAGTAGEGASPPSRHSAPLTGTRKRPPPDLRGPASIPRGTPSGAVVFRARRGVERLQGLPTSHSCVRGRATPRAGGDGPPQGTFHTSDIRPFKGRFCSLLRASRPGTALWSPGPKKGAGLGRGPRHSRIETA